MKTVTITVSGPTGSGKNIILREIQHVLMNSNSTSLIRSLKGTELVFREENSVTKEILEFK